MADILTRDAILAACGRRFVEVPLEGGAVRLGSLMADQLLEYHDLRDKGVDHVAWIIAASVVDAAGAPSLKLEDVRKLRAPVVMRLFKEAMDLNVISAEAAEEQRGN